MAEQNPPVPEKPSFSGTDINKTNQDAVSRNAVPASSPEAVSSVPTSEAISQQKMDRRTFIKWTAVGWAAFAGILGGYGTMILRFLFPNVLFEPKQFFKAGFPNEYQIGEIWCPNLLLI